MELAPALALVMEPTRRSILAALGAGPHNVSALVTATGREQSNVSHHLRTLRDAGLVVGRRVGREVHYSLTDPAVGRLLGELAALGDRLERAAILGGWGLPVETQYHGYG